MVYNQVIFLPNQKRELSLLDKKKNRHASIPNPVSYTHLIASYENIGFKRGPSVMIKLLQYLTDNLKLVVKQDKLFYYDMTPAEARLFAGMN